MSLNKQQIEEIKNFIHSHGFTHIEVEMEILDHVASAVEAKLEDNPHKSITKAIQEVHAGFGPLGFSIMKDEFRKSFGKHYQSIRRTILKGYLWSKNAWMVLLAIICSYALSTILTNLPPVFNLALLLILSTISWVSLYFYFRRSFKKWRKKSLVLSNELSRIGLSSYTIFYGIYYLDLLIEANFNSTILLTTCITLIIISAVYTKDCIEEVYHWTNERYLKYA